MQTQFVRMTQAGVKAYYSALKQQRREAAEFYRDHPECTLGKVQEKFKLSAPTMRKALRENGIEVDRQRNYGRHQERWTCPCCRKQVVHFCVPNGAREEKPRAGRVEPPHPVDVMKGTEYDTPANREYITRMFSGSEAKPRAGGEVADDGMTAEQREIAELGFDGLLARARKELGIG